MHFFVFFFHAHSLKMNEKKKKNGFRWQFWIFSTKPELYFSNLFFLLIITIKLKNFLIELWKYLNKFSSYWRKTGFRRPFWIFTAQTEVEFSNIYFTNYYYRSYTFAIKIVKISQFVLKLSAENRFLAVISNCYDKTGSRILEAIFLTHLHYRILKFADRILKIFQ